MSIRGAARRPDDPSVLIWWLATVLFATACLVVDLTWLGLPLCGLLACGLLALGLVVAVGVMRFLGHRRAAVRAGLRALLLLGFGLWSFFACQAKLAADADRARVFGAAIQAFHQSQGRYPDRLDELLQGLGPGVQELAGRWLAGRLVYTPPGPDKPALGWRTHALGGSAQYDFDQDLIRFRH